MWTKNPDGTEIATIGGNKVTLYQENNLWGYYFGDEKSEFNYGYLDKEFAIKDLMIELGKDEEEESQSDS